MGAERRTPGFPTHPYTTSPHQQQAAWGSTLGNTAALQHPQPYLDSESNLERSPPPDQPDALHLAAGESCQGAVSDVCLLQDRDRRVGRGQIWRELGGRHSL